MSKKEAGEFLGDFFKKNSRGQGLSTNAIILIILGVIILVILILGFTLGWGTILPWIKSNNVDTIVKACEAACATNSQYDFCSLERELKSDDLPGGEKSVKNTCDFFSETQEYLKYGVEKCLSVVCPENSEGSGTSP